jgi:hypothetical protein
MGLNAFVLLSESDLEVHFTKFVVSHLALLCKYVDIFWKEVCEILLI